MFDSWKGRHRQRPITSTGKNLDNPKQLSECGAPKWASLFPGHLRLVVDQRDLRNRRKTYPGDLFWIMISSATRCPSYTSARPIIFTRQYHAQHRHRSLSDYLIGPSFLLLEAEGDGCTTELPRCAHLPCGTCRSRDGGVGSSRLGQEGKILFSGTITMVALAVRTRGRSRELLAHISPLATECRR